MMPPRQRAALKALSPVALLMWGAVHAAGKYVPVSHATNSDAWWHTVKKAVKHVGQPELTVMMQETEDVTP